MPKIRISKSSLFIILLFSINLAHGQDEYVVSTNRPNQTDAVGVMAPGYIQLEAGIGKYSLSNNNTETNILFLPSTQFRVGIVENLEINVFYDYNNLKFKSDIIEVTSNNHFLTLGSKYHLWEEKGGIPEAAAVLNINYANVEGTTGEWDWEARLIFQNTLSSSLGLAYMIRFNDDFAGFALNPSYTINSNWSAFVEYYHVFVQGNDSNGLNMGLGYLVNNRITIDLMYGLEFIEPTSSNLFTTGLGWWIK